MIMETIGHKFIEVSLQDLQRYSRAELIKHLEARGCACYDDESTELLRQTAIEDWEGEL